MNKISDFVNKLGLIKLSFMAPQLIRAEESGTSAEES